MFDVKTYKDGKETETVRGLSWSQMTAIQSVLARNGIKFFTKQYDEAVEQKMHPTWGESFASDNESNPAPKRVI